MKSGSFWTKARSDQNVQKAPLGSAQICRAVGTQIAASHQHPLKCDLPAGETILDVVGDLFADVCQFEEFLLDYGIFGLLGKLSIHGRLLPQIVIPLHTCPQKTRQSRITGYWSYTTLAMLAIKGESPLGKMKNVIRVVFALMALAVLEQSVLARNYLNCLSKKVVIVDAPKGTTSSSTEENFGFWIDEATKIVTLADGKKLNVRRFDDRWVSAVGGDVSYELDRQNGNLTYAGSTTKDGVATTTIGAGRCTLTTVPGAVD